MCWFLAGLLNEFRECDHFKFWWQADLTQYSCQIRNPSQMEKHSGQNHDNSQSQTLYPNPTGLCFRLRMIYIGQGDLWCIYGYVIWQLMFSVCVEGMQSEFNISSPVEISGYDVPHIMFPFSLAFHFYRLLPKSFEFSRLRMFFIINIYLKQRKPTHGPFMDRLRHCAQQCRVLVFCHSLNV